jgi:hypothetical protein
MPFPGVLLDSWLQQIFKGSLMGLGTIILIILVLMLIGVFPTWPHSANWGYAPTGGLGLILLVVLVLVLMGKI